MEQEKWEVEVGVCYSHGTWETKSVVIFAYSEREAEKEAYKKVQEQLRHDVEVAAMFTYHIDLADDEPDEYEYDTVTECKAAGVHLKSCDDDGYCNHCGCQ